MGICKSKIIIRDEECPICFIKITEKNNFTTPCCKHNFHFVCISNWNRRNKSCPFCRKNIRIVQKIKVRRKSRKSISRIF